MIGAILVGMVAVLVLGQYWSLNFGVGHKPSYLIGPQFQAPKKPEYQINIDLNEIGLGELRKLDRAFRGSEMGENIHAVRKERIVNALNERRKRKKLVSMINEKGIDLKSLPLSQLEQLAGR